MDKMTCGEFGGVVSDGETPCKNNVTSPGRCHIHRKKSAGKQLPGGRPSHEPTPQSRAFVEACAMGGIPQDEICVVVGVSKPTLEKHYRDELDRAYTKANAKVVQTAFQQATSGKCPAMTIFWLKTRMGWSEKQRLEHSGPDGGPIEVDPLHGLTDEERRSALKRRLKQLDEIDRAAPTTKGIKG